MQMTYQYTEEEISKWCLLRGMEWGAWPLFVTQPIVPFLFLYFSWWKVITIVVVITWVWTFIRYKFVSVTLARFGAYFTNLKWIVSLGLAIFLFIKKQYFLASICGLYPLVVLILMFLVPVTKIGIIQTMFMNKLGYYHK